MEVPENRAWMYNRVDRTTKWYTKDFIEGVEEFLVYALRASSYVAKCGIAKHNRASSTGGTQHKGGSIPNTEHKRRLAEHLGRNPTPFELFTKTHYDEKTGEFVDQRSAEVSDHYMRIKASRSSNTDSPSDVQSNQLDEEEMKLYLEAAGGKNKKGRIFGLGSEAKNVDSSSFSYGSSPPSNNTVLQPEFQNVVTALRQENHDLKQQNQIILTRLDALEQKFSGAVNNSNSEAHNADVSPP